MVLDQVVDRALGGCSAGGRRLASQLCPLGVGEQVELFACCRELGDDPVELGRWSILDRRDRVRRRLWRIAGQRLGLVDDVRQRVSHARHDGSDREARVVPEGVERRHGLHDLLCRHVGFRARERECDAVSRCLAQ